MRRSLLVVVALGGVLGARAVPAAAPPPTTFALDHVSVIDVRTGAVATDRMVAVTRGRIVAVGASGEVEPPPGALLLDARASAQCAPLVASLLAKELGRDERWQNDQVTAFRALADGYLPAGRASK